MAVISQYSVVTDGQTITAALWNAMELNIINNGLIPTGIEDASAADADMQATTDPYPGAAISRATDLLGELKRIRYVLAQVTGETYWYVDPDLSIAQLKTHVHDGGSDDAPTIGTTGITNAAITADKLAAAVAGDGLAGGAGTPLSVNVDGSTIEINSDSLRVKDSGITNAKISACDWTKITQTTRPSFRAYTSGLSNVTGDGIDYDVVFNSEEDRAGNFSSTTFTCPQTGYYQFNTVIVLTNLSSASVETIDVYIKKGVAIVASFKEARTSTFPYTYKTINLSVVLSCSATDTIKVNVVCTGGSRTVGIDALSSFSGFFIG